MRCFGVHVVLSCFSVREARELQFEEVYARPDVASLAQVLSQTREARLGETRRDSERLGDVGFLGFVGIVGFVGFVCWRAPTEEKSTENGKEKGKEKWTGGIGEREKSREEKGRESTAIGMWILRKG